MSEEKVLTLRGKRAVWAPGGGSGPIDPKRLPEGYPYKERTEAVLAEETALVNGSLFNNSFEIVEGNEYTVTFDGEDYRLVAFYDTVYRFPTIGAVFDDYSEYPFSIIRVSNGCRFGVNDSNGHTVTVKGYVETIHPMSPEFLPAQALTFNVSLEPNQSGGYDGTPTVPYDEVLSAVNAGAIVVCKMIRTDDADNDVAVLYCQGTDGWGNIIFWGFENYQNRSGKYFVQATYFLGGSFSAGAPNTYFQIEPGIINLNGTGLNVSGDARFGATSLKIEGADGAYYTISVDESGNLVATK